MPIHLNRDLERISRKVLELGAMVEESVNKAIEAVMHLRVHLADEVITADRAIDEAEVVLEEDVLKALALHQPVASDLRYLICILKLNNDLERMGDLAVTMAERAKDLVGTDPLPVTLEFPAMAETARNMVRGCLDALVKQSATLARQVLAMDDEVDEHHKRTYLALTHLMREQPAAVGRAVNNLTVSRCLERIADLATNVAEDVIFLVEGSVVRHQLTWAKETEA